MKFRISADFEAEDGHEAEAVCQWLKDAFRNVPTATVSGPHLVTGQTKNPMIIYTDGGCEKDGSIGAWAYVMEMDGIVVDEQSGALSKGTNNTAEMEAVIQALKALKPGTDATIYCDSKYVIQGATEWLPNWKKRGWITFDKKPVKNRELWEKIDALLTTHKGHLTWQHVHGHIGVAGNERCDLLCNQAMGKKLEPAQTAT